MPALPADRPERPCRLLGVLAPAVKVEAPVATPGVVVPPGWHYNDTMPPTFVGMDDPTGTDGNLVDAADPALHDVDGSRADMGRYGGP